MAEDKKVRISLFEPDVVRNCGRLLDAYKREDEDYLHTWCVNTIKRISKHFNWSDYVGGDLQELWEKDIPTKVSSRITNAREMEDYILGTLMPYMCYICSLIEVDHYFRECDKVKNTLPLYIGSTQVSFIEKMIEVLPYSRFSTLIPRKRKPIFTKLDLMINSIMRNQDDARIQSDLADSIVTTTISAAKVKPINIIDL